MADQPCWAFRSKTSRVAAVSGGTHEGCRDQPARSRRFLPRAVITPARHVRKTVLHPD